MKALVDSDVLIDFFDGVLSASAEFNRYRMLGISRITWMEVLVGVKTPAVALQREAFMREISLFEIDETIAREAVHLRKSYRLKLPDAIIWATARENNLILVTRNARDFPRNDPGIRVPYSL